MVEKVNKVEEVVEVEVVAKDSIDVMLCLNRVKKAMINFMEEAVVRVMIQQRQGHR